MIDGKTYYQILGVLEDAEDLVIRAVYKSLCSKYHPDKWSGEPSIAHTKMSAINRAYDVLTDREKRRIYDEQIRSYISSSSGSSTNPPINTMSANYGKEEPGTGFVRSHDAATKEKSKLGEALWYVAADFQKTTPEERQNIKSAWITGLSLFFLALFLGVLLT